MEIHISTGEWFASMGNRMNEAMDGDVFCLPSDMHVHAFSLLKAAKYSQKNLEWTLRPLCEAHDKH